MNRNWLRLMIILAAVIIIAALAYAIYIFFISDPRMVIDPAESAGLAYPW